MEKELLAHLRTCAEAYAGARGIGLSSVALSCAKDKSFFERIQGDGATFTARKYDQAMQWFVDHWPEDAPWPDGVPRPDVSRETEKSDSRPEPAHS